MSTKLKWSEKATDDGPCWEAKVSAGVFSVQAADNGYILLGPWYDVEAREPWKWRWKMVASANEGKATAQQWQDETDALFATSMAEKARR